VQCSTVHRLTCEHDENGGFNVPGYLLGASPLCSGHRPRCLPDDDRMCDTISVFVLALGEGGLPSLRDIAVEGAELVLHVLEVPVLDPASRSTTVNSYHDFPQFLQLNAGIACQISPQLLLSKSPPFHS
jgi:hypothetical protein